MVMKPQHAKAKSSKLEAAADSTLSLAQSKKTFFLGGGEGC